MWLDVQEKMDEREKAELQKLLLEVKAAKATLNLLPLLVSYYSFWFC